MALPVELSGGFVRLIALGSTVVFAALWMSALVESAALGPGRNLCAEGRLQVPGACWWSELLESKRVLWGVAAAHVVVLFVALLSSRTKRRFEGVQEESPGLGFGRPGSGFHRSAMWSTSLMPRFLDGAHSMTALAALAWMTFGLVPGAFWPFGYGAVALVAFGVLAVAATAIESTTVVNGLRHAVRWGRLLALGLAACAIWRIARAGSGATFDVSSIGQVIGLSVFLTLAVLFVLWISQWFHRSRPTRAISVLVLGFGSALVFGSGVIEAIAWLTSSPPTITKSSVSGLQLGSS